MDGGGDGPDVGQASKGNLGGGGEPQHRRWSHGERWNQLSTWLAKRPQSVQSHHEFWASKSWPVLVHQTLVVMQGSRN